ncbi:MAG: Paraquat-inducible protein [Chthoniobacteraceae bacterium]|nr:Paraquat-inducible protein [Chthoniobacteraceae bacterium]
MTSYTRLNLALAAFLLSLILLVVGVTAPVITIRGMLMPDGLVDVVVDTMAAKAPPEEQVNFTGVGRQLKKTGIAQFISAFIPMNESKEVYVQTRSILGSVANLYRNGAWFAPTLILLFSICVPVSKAALLYSALMNVEGRRRTAILRIVNAMGKWSMADVFVVAIFIAYLAAKATVGTTQAVAFKSEFGIGFYFFAAYCIVALIGQQLANASIRADERLPGPDFRLLWQSGIGVVLGFVAAVTAAIFFKSEIENAPELFRNQFYFPYGLTFGFCVLAPLALRLSHGWIRAIAAVFYSHSVYILMAGWAAANHGKSPLLGGALPGGLGAILLLLGVRRLLHTRYSPRTFTIAVFLCSALGTALFANETPGGWFYISLLASQLIVAAAIVSGIISSQTILESIDTSVWHYRFSPALPCVVVFVFFNIYIAHQPLFPLVTRFLGIP